MKGKLGEGLGKLLQAIHGNGTSKKGLFFRRMLVWYTTCTSLLYLCFGILMSTSVQRNYREQISRLNERAIEQSVSACTTTLRDMYNYYYMNVLDSAELTKLLLADSYSADLSIHFSRLNSLLSNYNSLVESSYVINLVGGFVCSTSNTYRNLEDFPDQDILGLLELLSDIPRDHVLIPRQTSYTVFGRTHNRKYISFIFKKYKEGYVVINLNYDAFANMVNYRNYDAASQALLVNELGMVLADSREALFGEDISDEAFMLALAEKDEGEGEFKAATPDGNQTVLYRKNNLFGISYLILTKDSLFGGNMLLLHMIVYSVAAMAVNLGMILLGTCLLYHPIGKLQSLLGVGDQITNFKVDEFQVMERSFQEMYHISMKYSKSKKSRILKELLEDNGIQVDSSDQEYIALRDELFHACFVCANLYPNLEEEYRTNERMQLVLFSMENILRELLDGEILLECVDYGTYLVCLFNMDMTYEKPPEDAGAALAQSTETAAVIRALGRMQEKMNEYFHVDVSCSIGGAAGALDDIAGSYETALEAAFFQMTKEQGAMLRYSELKLSRVKKQEFPAELSREILDAVKNGDKGKIRNGISEFFGCMMHYHYHQAVKCIQLLELEITRLEMKHGIYHESMEGYLTEGAAGKRLYRLQEAFLNKCLKVAELCKEKKENNPNMKQIVEQIQELVGQNLTQRELSVTFLAKKLYLSTNYVRTIFKEITGGSLSSYIISKRIEKICELLQTTDWSGQQIADYMGFATKSYYYTFFKNYMGVTPNQYRKGGVRAEPVIPDMDDGKE